MDEYKETKSVQSGFSDDEWLPITKCTCGRTFDLWCFVAPMKGNGEEPVECPSCGRKFVWESKITIYEVS